MDAVVQNQNIAIAAAAKIALSVVEKVAVAPSASASALTSGIIPLFGIRWNREVCERESKGKIPGGKRIDELLCKLRNSNFPP